MRSCTRCGKPTYRDDKICWDCKEKEKQHPRYAQPMEEAHKVLTKSLCAWYAERPSPRKVYL